MGVELTKVNHFSRTWKSYLKFLIHHEEHFQYICYALNVLNHVFLILSVLFVIKKYQISCNLSRMVISAQGTVLPVMWSGTTFRQSEQDCVTFNLAPKIRTLARNIWKHFKMQERGRIVAFFMGYGWNKLVQLVSYWL